MACGARLTGPTVRDGNGAGAPPIPIPEAAPLPATAGAPTLAPPGTKQAYALSFGPVADERLRYRVARWIIERAPAHALGDVQEDLQRGTFVTFLALTAEEAEAARQGIHGLGVAPPLLRLAPATTAEMLLPERRARPKAKEARTGLGDWRMLLAAAVGLLIFGLFVMRLIGGRGF
jgi:hypothetical protein